ncbi:MAG: glutamate racemase [Polyangiaceae bacterium]|jgi:glutamate racemase|nr:glutamate racemase [Polyangiaceae bacterium]
MIGVYDSGFGGLTVLRRLRERLPHHDFLYLGDSGRAPYGGRDVHTLLDFAEQCVERLFEEGCRLVVVACNTVSCVALRHLQRRYAGPGSERRILGITIPAAEAAVAVSEGHVGVLATTRTVSSGTFVTEIQKLAPRLRVTQQAAPLLAPLIEEGWESTEIARLTAERYLAPLREVDTLVLGCTHYPLMLPVLRQTFHGRLLDPAPFAAERLLDWLERHPGFTGPSQGRLSFLCSGDPASFREHGARFLGAPIDEVVHIAEEAGRLQRRTSMQVVTGQILR